MERLIRTPEWFKAPETRYPDVASAVRHIFASVEEAQAYARSIGVNVDYEQRVDIAQLANEFLARLQERGLQMPVTLMVHSEYFVLRYPDRLEEIAAMGDQGVILINPAAQHWNSPILASRRLYAIRYWSTPSPLHVFFHEYGHLSQDDATRDRALTPRQRTLASAVSQRAQANVDEFLSEVCAGIFEGVQFDSDIMHAYYRLGGKRI